MKTCSKCEFIGNSELFRKNRNVCLECQREYNKVYAREYRKTEKSKQYRKNHELQYKERRIELEYERFKKKLVDEGKYSRWRNY